MIKKEGWPLMRETETVPVGRESEREMPSVRMPHAAMRARISSPASSAPTQEMRAGGSRRHVDAKRR